MEILLIRHGDPDYANDTLTPRGHDEARRLAEMLRDAGVDDLYVSPLGRAQATCAYTADRTGLTSVTLDWLRERGIKRGATYLWEAPGEMFLGDETLPTLTDWSAPEGAMPEGAEQFARVREGFDELLRGYGYLRHGHRYQVTRSSQRRIALFCHKGVILTLLADVLHWALPMVFVSLHIHPTGIARIEMIEQGGFAYPKALAINDIAHLGGGLAASPLQRPAEA